MRRLLTIVCAAAVLVGLIVNAAPAADAKSIPSVTKPVFGNDERIECLQLTPRERAIPALNRTVKQLRIAVLRDRGVTASRAEYLVNNARRSYAPLKIRIVLVRNEAVNFSGRQALELIAQAKAHLGGRRPAGADVVAVVTNADIVVGSEDLQGLADCIGGVGRAQRAFLVAEDTAQTLAIPDEGFGIGNVRLYGEFPSKVLAHEIGHLMGAHHHYGNCIEGVPSKPVEVSPCTLMGPSADLISFNFSTLNSIVVRGHAEKFLK